MLQVFTIQPLIQLTATTQAEAEEQARIINAILIGLKGVDDVQAGTEVDEISLEDES